MVVFSRGAGSKCGIGNTPDAHRLLAHDRFKRHLRRGNGHYDWLDIREGLDAPDFLHP